MLGRGSEFLNHSLQKIHDQTYKNIEVIVSDHANDDSIVSMCDSWSTKIKIIYVKEKNRGKSSTNINNAMSMATGTLVKILFQDDFLYQSDALEKILQTHEKQNKMWYATACIHTNDGANFYRTHFPRYHDQIHLGVNTIGAPSVITYVNVPDFVHFDDNLVWLMDCDYYKKMNMRFGPPGIINEQCVAIRSWGSNFGNLISQDIKSAELKYNTKKYQC